MTYSGRLTQTNPQPFVTNLPGSKSYTNRALVIAAQRIGTTRIVGGLHSQDTDYLAACLNAFEGLSVVKTSDGYLLERAPTPLHAPRQALYVGGAGTPARLLLAFACSAIGSTEITGNARLSERPMGHLIASLRAIGFRIDENGTPGCLPVRVHGGRATTRQWEIDGSISSQFVTSLLIFAALQNEGPVTLKVLNGLVSKPYVKMTLRMLCDCGIAATTDNFETFTVHPALPQPPTLDIEADASAMSYFLAAAAITRTKVVVPRIGDNSAQGDVQFASVLAQMGCDVRLSERQIELTGRSLRGVTVNMEDMPDTVLTLAAVAAVASGTTHIASIGNLRFKECDRIQAAATGLQSLGVSVTHGTDFLSITAEGPLHGATIPTFDDHRVAMSFAILGLIQGNIEIEDPSCVKKSFPNFWEEMDRFRHHHAAMEAVS
jgi:3-phosphoshikimate 1-carboxyvinyltransferase